MKGDSEITNSENVIDSRDIIDRIDYLEDERATLESNVTDAQEAVDELADEDADEETQAQSDAKDALASAQEALKDWDESDEGEELAKLKALADECEGYVGDWRHGATLISEDYFEKYAEELAGEVTEYNPNKVSWPFTCIDWTQAAEELKQDYTSVDFDGVDYWVR